MHDLVFASRQELVEELARLKRSCANAAIAWFVLGMTVGGILVLITFSA